jgi:hypothetical protein
LIWKLGMRELSWMLILRKDWNKALGGGLT